MTRLVFATTQSCKTLERVADAILSHRQSTADDLAAETGLSLPTLRRYIRELELDNRVHRVRPLGAGGPNGGIWAPGAAPREDGEPAAESIHLVVKHWRAGPVNLSALETLLFGRTLARGAAGPNYTLDREIGRLA